MPIQDVRTLRAARIAQIMLIRELQGAGIKIPEEIGSVDAVERRARRAYRHEAITYLSPTTNTNRR